MKTNPVGWFEIYVQDMNRAKAFYETVFALTLSELNNGDDSMKMLAFPGDMNAYGANGALVQMPECPSGGGGTLIYFSCNDCAVEASRVAANGGQLFREKFAIGEYGHIALAIDTEGNMFGLHSMQ